MAGGWLLSACEKRPAAVAADPNALPERIRVAAHGTWGSGKANSVMGIMQSNQYLEAEFEKDGVRVEWTPMDGGGIAINDAIANGQVDASSFGIFPQLVGRSRGIRTRILASQGFHQSYFVVRNGHPARVIGDLRGATIAVGLGAYTHHSTSLLLREHGIALPEVKLVNMETKDATAALAAKRIDGYLGGPQMFALEEKGIARIIYHTQGRKSESSAFGGLFVTEDFARRYPSVGRRFLRAYLKTAYWVSQPENREAYFAYQAQVTTTPLRHYRRDYEGRDLREAFNPLLDDHYVDRLRKTAAFCLENKIIRENVDVDSWVDRKTQASVLAELGLSNYWTALDVQGRPAAAAV